MREKTLFILSLMLMLYIAPLILMPYSSHTAILAQPNTTKEFQVSTDTWLDGWEYRQNMTVGSAINSFSANYQVLANVTYNAHMKTDFGDLRFTKADGTTQLSYYIAEYEASLWASIWILETEAMNAGNTISNIMYYGNSGVNTTSNGDNTFIFFDDFNSQNDGDPLNNSKWVIADQGSATVEVDISPASGSTAMLYYELSDGAPVCQVSNVDWAESQEIAVMYDLYMDLRGYQMRLGIKDSDDGDPHFQQYLVGTYLWHWNYRENEASTWADFDGSIAAEDTFYRVQYILDATSTSGVIETVNGSSIGTGELYKADATDGFTTYVMYAHGSISNPSKWYLDNFIVRKCENGVSEPTVNFYSEDSRYSEMWHIVNDPVTILFSVPIDETGLQTLLVFFGLMLIPTSTMYLVYHGKKGMSTDKIFYFLVAFIIGWGLFLGGIFG